MKFKWLLGICLILFLFSFLAFLSFETPIVKFLIPFFPKEDKAYGFFADLFKLAFYEFGWVAFLLTITWFLWANPSAFFLFIKIEQKLLRNTRVSFAVILVIFFIITLSVAWFALEHFPNSSDEYVYLYQAETLAGGKLWENTHPLRLFFEFNHVANKDGLAVGRFPPGWPLILSVAIWLGIPVFLVNPILAVITLFVFYKFAKKLYGSRVALWSMLMMAFTSFYIFNAASYFSHGVCLLQALLFVYCIYLFLDTEKIKYGILAGLFIGLIMLTRYYTAFLIGLPFFISLLYRYKLRCFKMFFWIGVGAIPCLLFLLWYNYAITGNSLIPVTMWAYKREGLGFIKGHTVAKGIEHIIRRIIMFIYWCSPSLLLLYLYFLWKKIRDKTSRLSVPEDYFFIVLIIGYFFYYEIGGNQYGPRFYFEALPFLIVFVVYKIFKYEQRSAKALFYAGLFCAIIKVPFIAFHEHEVIEERKDVYELVRENNVKNAVVFITTSTSVMRPMPIGDLTRNDKLYKNDVLYARDYGDKNRELMKYYQGRTFYRYIRDPESPRGELIKIE